MLIELTVDDQLTHIDTEFSTSATLEQTGQQVIDAFGKYAEGLGVPEATYEAGMQYGNQYDYGREIYEMHNSPV